MNKLLISFITFLILQGFLFIMYMIGHIPPLIFLIFVCVLYLVSLPKHLMSSKNIIFAYYFLWYGMAPSFAIRFKEYTFTTEAEMLSYLMLFFTYGISLVSITFFEKHFDFRSRLKNDFSNYKDLKNTKIILFYSFIIIIGSLFFYISKTGGISSWIKDSTTAYINRKGAGLIYLVFLHSLMVFSLVFGLIFFKTKKKALIILYFIFIILLYVFIGSKAQIMLLLFLAFGCYLINVKLNNIWTIRMITIVGCIFLAGIYQRNYTWISFSDFFPYVLNYFNTYEMLVTLVRDFDPTLLKTVFLPLNWVLMKFGYFINIPYHDISIWLTSIYYPLDFAAAGTQQWPIEADMYMSFYYILGIPFLVLYLYWIEYSFYMAKQGYVSWLLIYIVEFVYLLSHYRGGLILYWYFWLIPFYILVLFIFKDTRVNTRS